MKLTLESKQKLCEAAIDKVSVDCSFYLPPEFGFLGSSEPSMLN
jgi:hypothetical protein